MFKDISNFNNINDYLSILNGCMIAYLIIIFFVYNKIIFNSNYLRKWYKKYQLSAVIADVLILVIGIILARFLYKYLFTTFNIFKFIFLALVIQVTHDILFYIFFTYIPTGYNKMLDFFKDYAKEVGTGAIFGDSFMMIIACLFSSIFASYNFNFNIIILVFLLYLFPYMINYQ